MRRAIILAWLFMGLLLGACSSPNEPPTEPEPEVKVHPKDWLNKTSQAFHGTVLQANNYDMRECAQCHGRQFNGGIVGVSCKTCHPTFPHPDNWTGEGEDSHGEYLESKGYDVKACQGCHGENFDIVKVKNSCRTCHATYPHADNWKGPGEDSHGEYLKAKDYELSSCKLCHGENLDEVMAGNSCVTCHEIYPHGEGWAGTGENSHGQYLQENGYPLESCQTCHGENFDEVMRGQSCRTCHALYPHVPGWITPADPNFHGTYLSRLGYELSSCQTCHGQNFDEIKKDTSCRTCHDSFPHPEGWPGTGEGSHGAYLRASGFKVSDCQPCHGDNYDRVIVNTSCRTCHETYPHVQGWAQEGENSHGEYLKRLDYPISTCQPCHGENYDEIMLNNSCRTCHEIYPHAAQWAVPGSDNFHGDYLEALNYDATSCQSCHGENYDEVMRGKSCRTCHESFPHPTGWIGTGAESHGNFLKNAGYPLQDCQTCHGENYDVVKENLSCRSCHTGADGPEGCNTCHGNFSGDPTDLRNAAPPKGLDDATDPTAASVGMHGDHLEYFGNASMTCRECHNVPQTWRDSGHIDSDNRAEVIFNGPLSTIVSDGGALVPSPGYDPTTLSCQNTFCHGNWATRKEDSKYPWAYVEDRIRGNNASPVWTDDATGECGTCHDLPPKGHVTSELRLCSGCHTSVMDEDGNITDTSKHVNGKINVFGEEIPMQ